MSAPHHTADTCEGCGTTALGVDEATIEGEVVSLCRGCNNRVILGGASLDEIGVDVDGTSTDTMSDPELPVDVTPALLDDLTETQREDYRAVVLEGKGQQDQADDRGVTQSAVSFSISAARDRLRELADERRAA